MTWSRVAVVWGTGALAALASLPALRAVVLAAPVGAPVSVLWFLGPWAVAVLGGALAGRVSPGRAEGAITGAAAGGWAWWLGLGPAVSWHSMQPLWQQIPLGKPTDPEIGRQILVDCVSLGLVVGAVTWLASVLGAAVVAMATAPSSSRPRPMEIWWASHWTLRLTIGLLPVNHAIDTLRSNFPTEAPLAFFQLVQNLAFATAIVVTFQQAARLRAGGQRALALLHTIVAWGGCGVVTLAWLLLADDRLASWSVAVVALAPLVAWGVDRNRPRQGTDASASPDPLPEGRTLAAEIAWLQSITMAWVVPPVLVGVALSASIMSVLSFLMGKIQQTVPLTIYDGWLESYRVVGLGLALLLPLDPLLLVPAGWWLVRRLRGGVTPEGRDEALSRTSENTPG